MRNPEVVPDPLQQAVAAARRHHHLQLETQATPEPQRFSWQVILHRYEQGEQNLNTDPAHRAEETASVPGPDEGPQQDVICLYEVVVTRHLNDTEPVCYLALKESDVPELIGRGTEASA
ncbi:hypothetical protein ACIBUY_04030 [Streptomyces sp. NPDC050085]|uniref:hypothetical protein n=1 Tax=Streptomyces sp. NPDC050085 TaxID=3365600 RepID=UPI0037A2E5DB